MIVLAGIIVREGVDFVQAVIHSAAARAKPITLTGVAAMVGAFLILDGPIFPGLAVPPQPIGSDEKTRKKGPGSI